jgi:hypothetical protein
VLANSLSAEDEAVFLSTLPRLPFTPAAAELERIYVDGMRKAQALAQR